MNHRNVGGTMTFLRVEKKSLLLGQGNESNYVYIPLSSIVEVTESRGDVTIHYKGLKEGGSSVLVENSSVCDVLSETNLIEL